MLDFLSTNGRISSLALKKLTFSSQFSGADRRVQYLEEAFHSFDPENSKDKFVEEMKEFSTSVSQEKSEHIYSEDPLTQSPIYERIDDFDMTKSKEIAV
mgnify:FL=1